MPLPCHLNSGRAEGFAPEEVISQYELGTMRNFVYLILDRGTKTAAIVDPQKDLRPLEDLEAAGYRLTRILLTHSHHDHIAGVLPLLARYPDLPIFVHPADTHRLKNIPVANLRLVSDGEIIAIGGIRVEALHSPGHSAGELCYRIDHPMPGEGGFLLTGDTLFIRDCGRTDLAHGNNAEMFETLQRLKTLPDELVVLPGHHYAEETASLLGTEKKTSPPLQCRSSDELASLL